MLFDLVLSTALLLALSVLVEFNLRAWGDRRRPATASAGLIFGLIAVVAMAHPITLQPGIIFDGRSVVLGMAGLFGGAFAGIIAGVVAAAYRGWLGGDGAAVGIAVIATSVLLGLAYRQAVARGWARQTAFEFLIFGIVVHVAALCWFTLLPRPFVGAVFGTLAPIYLAVLAPATMLLGLLLRDLETQRRDKQALVASEAMQQAIIQASPDLLLVIDEDGRFLRVISPQERLLYVRASELPGRRVDQVLPEADAARFMEFLRRVVDAGTPQVIEYPMQTLGGPHVFEGRGQALGLRVDGRRVVVFVARDITERVAAEQERRIASIAFEAHQGMLITDAGLRILQVNDALLQMCGYGRGELVGATPRLLVSDRHDEAFHAAMAGKLAASGQWEGEVWSRRRHGEEFPAWMSAAAVRDERGTITHHVVALTDISQRKRREDAIRDLAFHDPLTGVANRRLLLERLGHALSLARRRSHHGALLFLDLDEFKQVNDRHGHHGGDRLLAQAAQRLREVVRETDTVARIGGDEFVLLLEHLHGERERAAAEAEQVARKALRALAEPFDLDGQACQVSASVGIALFDHRTAGADELLAQADRAMYEAKSSGKNGLRMHDGAPRTAAGGDAA